MLNEFGTTIFQEMDYVQEGHNAERFARILRPGGDSCTRDLLEPYHFARIDQELSMELGRDIEQHPRDKILTG